MAVPEALSERIRLLVQDTIREELPFMRQEKVNEAAQLCKDVVSDYVEASISQIEESKKAVTVMKLPREIRNHIFRRHLVAEEHIEQHLRRKHIMVARHTAHEYPLNEPVSVDYLPDSKWMAQPPLTKVSKAIRAETLPVFYGANIFRTYAFPTQLLLAPDPKGFVWLDYAFQWLRAIGPEIRKLIKNVEVRRDAVIIGGPFPVGQRLTPHAVVSAGLDRSLFTPRCFQFDGLENEDRRRQNEEQAKVWAALHLTGEEDLLGMGLARDD